MRRYDWLREIRRLDPERDFLRIYRIIATHEFPWDMTRALELALYRTYAVPSIGRLLAETAELTDRTQKRYDDTALLLDAVVEHGFDSTDGRTAIRRINQMHRGYDISNEDMRYVLCTFVVVPKRWLDEYGWRRLTAHEQQAVAAYYRTLGRHMGITAIPQTYEDFERCVDAYEAAHFGWDEGARRVSDATLDLMAGWYGPLAPVVRGAGLALLDELPGPARRGPGGSRMTHGRPVSPPGPGSPPPDGQRQIAGVLVLVPDQLPPGGGEKGPQIRLGAQVAGGQRAPLARGEGRPPDGVEQRQPATGAYDPGEFGQAARRVGQMGQQPGGEDRVQRGVRQRQPGHVREEQRRLTVPPGPHGGLQHLGREIRAQHRPARPHGRPQRGQRTPRTAAGVQDPVAFLEAQFGDARGVGRAVVGELGVPAARAGGEERADLVRPVGVMVGHRAPSRAGRSVREAAQAYRAIAMVRGTGTTADHGPAPWRSTVRSVGIHAAGVPCRSCACC